MSFIRFVLTSRDPDSEVAAGIFTLAYRLVNAQISAGEGDEDYSGIAKVIFKLAALNS